MTHEQQAIWRKIRDFRLDAENEPYPFSARLARENGWTPAFARRVIDEYRKFAFLSVVAGHGVTPSKAVDEAWHLHLLYTRNYWEEFCPHALGKHLHHNPSGGGAEDEAKYQDWYRNTVASYERLFGEAPPPDIWPGEQPVKNRRRWWPLLAWVPLILTGCGEPANPLDWHGPEFLKLFFGILVASFSAAGIARYLLMGPADGPPAEEWELGIYDKAYLNGGAQLALATAITHLAAAGRLEIQPKTGRMRTVGEAYKADHPLERSILGAADHSGGALYDSVQRRVKGSLDEIEASLRRQGLWVSREAMVRSTVLPFLIAGSPILLGIMKISVGMSRNRPVDFLVAECVLGFCSALLFLIPPKRSPYGNRALESIRADTQRRGRYRDADPSALAVGVAVFGLGALDGTEHAHLRSVVVPASSAGGNGGGGSSCGGSSCGGGCGGGCGGCGS